MQCRFPKFFILLFFVAFSLNAYAIPNLAFNCPSSELLSDSYLVVGSDDPIFAEYNRSMPAPLHLIVQRSVLERQESPATVERLAKGKVNFVRCIMDRLASIDRTVVTELEKAGIGIEMLPSRLKAEVPTQYIGRMGSYKFTRGWSYWIVSGDTDMALATEIYNDPIGHEDIRTNGYSGNISPSEAGLVTSYHIDTAAGLKRFIELVQAHELRKHGIDPMAKISMTRSMAMRYPRAELESDQYVFIESGDPLYQSFNTTLSSPRFIVLTTDYLKDKVTPGQLAELQRKKADVAKYFAANLESLDSSIAQELLGAGVGLETLRFRDRGEVPFKTIGRFGKFKFVRRWAYWSVSAEGGVDSLLANTIYNDPVGRRVIRTNGYSGNISPSEVGLVDHFHIDTYEGLKRFVELVQKHYIETTISAVPESCGRFLGGE